MKSDLERLLKAMDAFRQAPTRHEDARLRALYHAELDMVAAARRLDRHTLDRMVTRGSRYSIMCIAVASPPGRRPLYLLEATE